MPLKPNPTHFCSHQRRGKRQQQNQAAENSASDRLLGGFDPFIVLEDADLTKVQMSVRSRYLIKSGQG
jgi:acyl-CoA reductase-like NAD-dependent aldehyde dehydrogenase